MDIIGWHITFDLRGRAPLARTAEEWDLMVLVLWRVLEPWHNLCFCLVHDHLHVLVAVDRETAGRVAQAVECALGWRRRAKDTPRRELWNPPRFTPIRDRQHLGVTALYVLLNGSKATGTDPLAWRWSSAWGTLGLCSTPHRLGTGFEVTSQAFVADAISGSFSWRPPIAEKLETPADPPTVLWRVAVASIGRATGKGMGRAEKALARRIFVALAEHRGWSVAAAAAAAGLPRSSLYRATREPASAEEMQPALRLLGLLEGGYPIDELLPSLPPDPLPKGSQPRVTRGPRGRK
jgi:hypothetical protein